MKIYAMIYIPYFVIQYFKFCHVWLYYFICFSIFHSLSVSHGWSCSDTITVSQFNLKHSFRVCLVTHLYLMVSIA